MHPLRRLDVQVEHTVLFADRGIFGEKRTRLATAEAGDIVLVAAETLCGRSAC